jgi:hypothetical protein
MRTLFQSWFSWIPSHSLFAACNLFRFRFPSTKSFGTHTLSLASLLTTSFAILRNYDCLTEAIRTAFANCATLSHAFSILFGCRIPFTFCLPPCVLRMCFFRWPALFDSLRVSEFLLLSASIASFGTFAISPDAVACDLFGCVHSPSISLVASASFRSRKLDCLRCVSGCF